ncbi:MAG: leucine-rich repeat protein [Ruminococcus sp.]|nr:leucine-rich repeat protein [Ruminococcus sp.]
MKRLLSIILSVCLAFQGISLSAGAIYEDVTEGDIRIVCGSVYSGKTFSVPIKIYKNPGVISMAIDLSYDSNLLDLVSVEDGKLFDGAEFLSSEQKEGSCRLVWDDFKDEDHTETGVLVNLNFRAHTAVEGEASIIAHIDKSATLNSKLETVPFGVQNGDVKIRYNPDDPTLECDSAYAVKGDIVELDINMYNNPGLAAMSLEFTYPTEFFELLEVRDGGVLGDSVFMTSKSTDVVPYILNWDDLSDENNTSNGVLATLVFKVIKDPIPDTFDFNWNYPIIDLTLRQNSTFNKDFEEIPFFVFDGIIEFPSLEALMTNEDGEPLEYKFDSIYEPVNIDAEAGYVSCDGIRCTSYTDDTTFNNGFGYNGDNDCLHEIVSPDGSIYAMIKCDSSFIFIPEDSTRDIVTISKEGWKIGSVVFDDDGCLYALWGRKLTNADVKNDDQLCSLSLVKYDSSFKEISELQLPVSETQSLSPFTFGNAALGYKAGIVFAAYDTLWTRSEDGLNHQGLCYLAVRAETMKLITVNTWQGSHSFGVSMIPTSYGFTLIQMGDAVSRGIVMNHYGIFHGRIFDEPAFDSENGYRNVFHSNGVYGSISEQLDGNTTYTHMGGIATSKHTFAIAGKAERVYSNIEHDNSPYATDKYDVFVRLLNHNGNGNGLGGEKRIDGESSKAIDNNVVWLTECNKEEQAGAVKVVTLGDGAYCVLWEKFVNGVFENVHYVILDEYGSELRPESIIQGARLSDNSTQPFVDGYKLTWAVAYGEENKLAWYSADLAGIPGTISAGNYETIIENGLTFRIYSDHAELEECDSEAQGSVIIPDKVNSVPVTKIRYAAFYSCKEITSVKIPDSVVVIGDRAFGACTSLESINIPENVAEIGSSAFVPYIRSGAYFGRPDALGVNSITVSTANKHYTSVDGVLYNKDKTVLIAYPSAKSDNEYAIPDGVVRIDKEAFYGAYNLDKVIFPDTLKRIESGVFEFCVCIDEVELPSGLKYLGGSAFSNTRSLSSIVIPASVEAIDDYAFFYTGAEMITIMNPNCAIFDSRMTFTDNNEHNYSGVIRGYEGSTAQAYAEKYGCTFESLGKITTSSTTSTTTTTTTSTTTSTTTTSTTTTTTTTSTSTTSTTTLKYNSVMDERILGSWIVSKSINTDTGESLLDLSAADYILSFNDDFTGTMVIVEKSGAKREEVMFWTADEKTAGGKDKVAVYGDGDTIPTVIDLNTMTFTDTNPKYVYYLEKRGEPASKFGDIDGNGVINAVDASKILVKCAELSAPDAELPGDDVIAKFDINGDGLITAVDASFVLAYCADLADDPDLKIKDFIASRKK